MSIPNPTDRRDGPRGAAEVRGYVTVTTYDTDEVYEYIPEWDDRDALESRLDRSFEDEPDPLDAARIAALREFVPYETRERSENTTVADLHEYLVDHLDVNQSVTALSASHLALGTDNTSPSVSDSSLGAEQYREGFDSTTDAGNDLESTTLLDENEGNGYTYEEVGIFTAASGGTMFNRSLISSTPKNSDNTATFEVVLQFRAA